MTEAAWWEYDQLPSGEPYDWGGTNRGEKPWDNQDFHIDLGCGRVKKARLGIDHQYSPGVDLLIDLEELMVPGPRNIEHAPDEIVEQTYNTFEQEAVRRDNAAGYEERTTIPAGFLPFPDNSIESVISHHALEHIGPGFMRVMDEVHRILKPGGLFRIIVPAYPSHAAVADPTHVRYFCEGTWHTWVGMPDGPKYTDGFAEPYTQATFILEDIDMTGLPFLEGTPIVDMAKLWGPEGAREFRVAYRKHQ
jgi:SAM-dependent methyltransferase